MTHEDATYRCPYCPAEYPTEMLTRVHVSYAGDERHEGRNGMTPEVEPVECDASGEAVGTAFTLAGQLNLHGLSLSEIPAEYRGRTFDERERRALLVAALNASRRLAVTELQDRVTAHLDEHDRDPLSTRELRDLCEYVFEPYDDAETEAGDEGEIATAETALRDLTPRQQALVVAHIASPDAPWPDLATAVGTAASYPKQVIETRADLVARLRVRAERTGLERLVAERIPAPDCETIRTEGYLEGFEVDMAAVGRRKRLRGDPTGNAQVTPADGEAATDSRADADDGGLDPDTASRGEPATDDSDPESETDSQTETDSRVDAEADGKPNPDDSRAGSTGVDSSDTPEPVERTRDAAGGTENRHDRTRGHEDGPGGRSSETVSRAEVEAVREQVAFDLAVVDEEMDLAEPTPQQVRTKAYLRAILARLDEILEE